MDGNLGMEWNWVCFGWDVCLLQLLCNVPASLLIPSLPGSTLMPNLRKSTSSLGIFSKSCGRKKVSADFTDLSTISRRESRNSGDDSWAKVWKNCKRRRRRIE